MHISGKACEWLRSPCLRKPGAFFPTHQDVTLVKTCCGLQDGFGAQKGLSDKVKQRYASSQINTKDYDSHFLCWFEGENLWKLFKMNLKMEKSIWQKMGMSRILQMSGFPIIWVKRKITMSTARFFDSCWFHVGGFDKTLYYFFWKFQFNDFIYMSSGVTIK